MDLLDALQLTYQLSQVSVINPFNPHANFLPGRDAKIARTPVGLLPVNIAKPEMGDVATRLWMLNRRGPSPVMTLNPGQSGRVYYRFWLRERFGGNDNSMQDLSIPNEKVIPFGGALHCTTLDVYRESELVDYFPKQIKGF